MPSQSDHFNNLTPAQAECLALLSDELAEALVCIAKINRHGLKSFHPRDPKQETNLDALTRELGDLMGAIEICVDQNLFNWAPIARAQKDKIERVGTYLHHIKLL